MSKIIAVCGSPDSGKTTVAVKIAQGIQRLKRGIVLYVSFDWNVPSLSYIFPQQNSSELFSIGKIFDLTDIYKEDVLKQTVTTKDMPDIGYLGFKAGENKYTYPFPTKDKVTSFFGVLKGISEFIVVDCTNNTDDVITEYALNNADNIIETISPDFKGITYLSSAGLGELTTAPCQRVINITYNDFFLPTREVKNHCENIDLKLTLPYSRELKKQLLTGSLSNRLADKRYNAVISEIVKGVI